MASANIDILTNYRELITPVVLGLGLKIFIMRKDIVIYLIILLKTCLVFVAVFESLLVR